MRFGLLLSVAAVLGCVAQIPLQRAPGPTSSMPDGTWTGKFDWVIRHDGVKSEGYEIAIATCDGRARRWIKNEQGEWRSNETEWTISSGPDSHTLQFVEQFERQPDWVEIQTITLLEMNDELATVQWSRAVNNRDLANDNSNRSFFGYGTGTLKRIRVGCTNPPLNPS